MRNTASASSLGTERACKIAPLRIPGFAWALQNSTAMPPPVRRSFFAHRVNQKPLVGVRGHGSEATLAGILPNGRQSRLMTPAIVILCKCKRPPSATRDGAGTVSGGGGTLRPRGSARAPRYAAPIESGPRNHRRGPFSLVARFKISSVEGRSCHQPIHPREIHPGEFDRQGGSTGIFRALPQGALPDRA
jgi:hypothetical protein